MGNRCLVSDKHRSTLDHDTTLQHPDEEAILLRPEGHVSATSPEELPEPSTSTPTATMTTQSTRGVSRASTLGDTWREFQRALRSPHDPFNPLIWIHRLFLAGLDHLYVSTGCIALVHRYQLNKVWRPVLPCFGLMLVIANVGAYFGCLRSVMEQRWCPNEPQDITSCHWMYLHDVCVIYLTFMFSFHYVTTMMRSPGIALPEDPGKVPKEWKRTEGQGGILFWNAAMDEAAERQRVALYGPLQPRAIESPTKGAGEEERIQKSPPNFSRNFVYFPSPETTFCEKCQILRPSRCHHCSFCHRCVLQFDHHCIWVNQCIGYNNYRHFVSMIFFLVLCCWYGVSVLFFPFYLPLQQRIKEHEGGGWMHMLYTDPSAFLNPPAPHILIYQACTFSMTTQTVVDLVFPLLLGLGALMTGFLVFHVYYIVYARTTLEHKILLDGTVAWVLEEQGRPPDTPVVNPFNQKSFRLNVQQVLGTNPLLLFVPMTTDPPPPIIPKYEKNQ